MQPSPPNSPSQMPDVIETELRSGGAQATPADNAAHSSARSGRHIPEIAKNIESSDSDWDSNPTSDTDGDRIDDGVFLKDSALRKVRLCGNILSTQLYFLFPSLLQVVNRIALFACRLLPYVH